MYNIAGLVLVKLGKLKLPYLNSDFVCAFDYDVYFTVQINVTLLFIYLVFQRYIRLDIELVTWAP